MDDALPDAILSYLILYSWNDKEKGHERIGRIHENFH